MRNFQAACVSALMLSGVAMAQDNITTATAPAAEPVRAVALTTTTANQSTSGQALLSDARTTRTANSTTMTAARRQFTQQMFEERWKNEENMYREAGISEDKIQKLRDLNSRMWEARSSGERSDFQTIMRERAEILTQQEVEKIREIRRSQIEKELGRPVGGQGRTTGVQRILPANR